MNDFQNAYELSKMEHQSSCQKKEMDELLYAGKFVVGFDQDIHCPFTDALISVETHILSVHDTMEEAREAYDDEYGIFIAEPKTAEPEFVEEPEYCPF